MKFVNKVIKSRKWYQLWKPKQYMFDVEVEVDDKDIEKVNKEYANSILQKFYEEDLDPFNTGGYYSVGKVSDDFSGWFNKGYWRCKSQRIKHLEIFMRNNDLGLLKNIKRYKGY